MGIVILILLVLFGVLVVLFCLLYCMTPMQAKYRRKLEEVGLVHFTTKEFVDRILAQKVFLPNKQCDVYFFANEPVAENVFKYNIKNKKKPYEMKIIIKGLSQEQLKSMKRRRFDGAFAHHCLFDISQNECEVMEYSEKRDQCCDSNYFDVLDKCRTPFIILLSIMGFSVVALLLVRCAM